MEINNEKIRIKDINHNRIPILHRNSQVSGYEQVVAMLQHWHSMFRWFSFGWFVEKVIVKGFPWFQPCSDLVIGERV